jgi:hypothetical protein
MDLKQAQAAAESERQKQEAIDSKQAQYSEKLRRAAQKNLSSDRKSPGPKKREPHKQGGHRDLFDDQAADESSGRSIAAWRGRERPVARLMSLENEKWMSIRKSADTVMHQTLASGLERHNIVYRVTEHGVEIAAYSRDHILAFSDGLKSVQKALEVRGFSLETASGKAKEVANLAMRSETKRIVPLEAVQKMWLLRAKHSGFPAFAPDDARLNQGPVRQAMTPGQAIGAALDQVQLSGKRIHGDFALVREAIKRSEYATPHLEISREVARQLESGEVVHTEQGILPRADAVLVAKQSQAQLVSERRTELAADLRRLDFVPDPTHPSSASLLQGAQRAALASAVDAGSGAVVLSSAEAVGAVASVLADSVEEHGLRLVVVSSDASDVGGVSFAAGVAVSGTFDAGAVVVIADGSENAESSAVIRAAALRAGAMCIELEREAPSLRASAPDGTNPVQAQKVAQAPSSKLAQLGSLVTRHGATLRSAMTALRGERQSVGESSAPRRTVKQ